MSKGRFMTETPERNPDRLSFWGHVDELRYCVVRSAAVVTGLSVLLYGFADPLLDFIIRPVGKVVFTSVADAFIVRLQLALAMGFLAGLPYVLWQAWAFVAAGLKEAERKYVLLYGPFSLLAFFLGGMFAYTVMVPVSLQFLLGFATGAMEPMITVDNYVNFVGTMVLAFGIVFELPLVMLFLTQIGVATPEFLVHYRRHAVMAILVVSALITPPDCVTLLIMAAPLIVLYEAGIVLSKAICRRRAQAKEACRS